MTPEEQDNTKREMRDSFLEENHWVPIGNLWVHKVSGIALPVDKAEEVELGRLQMNVVYFLMKLDTMKNSPKGIISSSLMELMLGELHVLLSDKELQNNIKTALLGNEEFKNWAKTSIGVLKELLKEAP